MTSNKEITIYDIARALNISASTVSRGLNNHPHVRQDTRKKIITAAREMEYQRNKFATNLRQKCTNTIGVVVPRLNSYFQSRVIAGIEKVANQSGYHLIISQSLESLKNEIASISTMFNARIDGLIVSIACNTRNLKHFDILFKKKIPVVFFDRFIEHPDCISVVIDNYKAGYEATMHLIDQGCRRIIYIGGNLYSNVYADRLSGYKKSLEDNGIDYFNNLIFTDELNEQTGIEAVKKILNMKTLPDGIFTANDVTAATIICKLKDAGISIPGDIAVVGFNNDLVSRVIAPDLTTIHYPGLEMGEIAASTLINRLNNSQSANLSTIVIQHHLIIRQSSLKMMVGSRYNASGMIQNQTKNV